MGNVLVGQLFSSRYHYQWRKQAWRQRHVLLQIFRSYSAKNATKNTMQCKHARLTYISDVITETGFDISKVKRSTLCNNLQIFNSPIILKYNWRREIENNENIQMNGNQWTNLREIRGNLREIRGKNTQQYDRMPQSIHIVLQCHKATSRKSIQYTPI